MADYASNFSPRYVFSYRSAGAQHNVQVRLARGTVRNDVAVTTKMAAAYPALETLLFTDFAFLTGVYYPEDAFLGFPVSLGDMVDVIGSSAGVPSAVHKALQLRLEARGDLGGRTSLTVFGTNLADIDGNALLRDFRITPGEVPVIGTFITAISELAPAFVPLGSTSAIWKNYANLKYNDAWVEKIREGT